MSFEWQTEEDSRWDEEVASPEPSKRARRRWPWWLLLGVVLVGTAVFFVYRQLNQRIETATNDVEADLLASYDVLQRAAQNKDENLFSSLLSGRDDEWAQAQRELLNAGLLFDRSAFGLEWVPRVAETAVISQTFAPDLRAAELTTLQNYSLDIGNGLTRTVQLERTDVYRLGQDRWLYAPPEQEFWGARRRLEGQLLSVRYPARDEEIVHRLAADLEAKLVQVCSTDGFDCPPDARVRLIFSPEPDSLIQANFLDALARDQVDLGAVWRGSEPIVLPTPTLVGLSQDETGYNAISRGYAAQMLTIAINDLVGWDCCFNAPFYRAAMMAQLADLGVVRWPLTDTAVTLPNDLSLQDGSSLWLALFPETDTDFEQNPAPYAVVDFLNRGFGVPPSRMLRTLALNKFGTINEMVRMSQWLVGLLGSSWTEARLDDSFRQYVMRWQDAPAVLPEPEDGLVLLCHDPLRVTQGLYYFDYGLEEPLLLEPLPYDEQVYFTSLPGGDGLAVLTRESPTSQPETYLLRNGEQRVDLNWANVQGITSAPPLAVPTMTDGNGRYLLWTIMPAFANGNFFAVTDLDVCRAGDSCAAIPVGGYPTWSPSGEQLISLSIIDPWWTEGRSNGMMLLRDEPTSTAINSPGFGASVFWLDETQFGYLTQYQNGLQHLVLSDVTLSGPRLLLTNQSLLEDVPPPGDMPTHFSFQFAQPLPLTPSILAIMVTGQADGQTSGHLYFYNYVTESMVQYVLLENWRNAQFEGYRFSPDGRFLFTTYANPDETAVNLTIYDTQEARVLHTRLEGASALPRHFYASWSPKGDWLAVPELGYLRLWYEGWDERLLSFDGLSCTNAAWTDRIEMVNGE